MIIIKKFRKYGYDVFKIDDVDPTKTIQEYIYKVYLRIY